MNFQYELFYVVKKVNFFQIFQFFLFFKEEIKLYQSWKQFVSYRKNYKFVNFVTGF